MSAHKFTPGPWEWDGNVCSYDPENEAPWLVQAPWQTSFGRILHGSINCENEANARLITAAPDLLEALEIAVSLIDGDLIGTEWKKACYDFVQKAKPAITKALGGEA